MSTRPLPRGRARLATVLEAAGDVLSISDVAHILRMERHRAAQLLARWTEQGWLRRVGPRTYVPVPIAFLQAEQVLADPWILVPSLFDPAYIGGRTAAEYWNLTEQMFRDTVVFTARTVRRKTVRQQTAIFSLRHIGQERIFGTTLLWRGHTRVAVSDIHRTLVDMLCDPSVGGGIQHVEDCFAHYLKRPDCNPAILIKYADGRGNGAVFKRLGFLAERQNLDQDFLAAVKDRLTKGHAHLDPTLSCHRLVSRWRLRVPASWLARRPA